MSLPLPAERRALLPRQVALMRAAGLASVLVALLLITIKSWAWFATDSVSLLGSLVDSLLDLIASLITFFAVRVAVEPPDREHRFGHGKSEAIAGLSQAMIVSASALYLAVQALQRLLAPTQVESPELGMSVIGASLLLTGALVAFQRYVIARTGSLAISADSLHYKADLLTNAAVILAIVLNYYADWYLADPLLGLVMVVLILHSVRSIVTRAIDVLLDRELPNEDRSDIKRIALSHSAVFGVHDMRTRSSGVVQFIQLHLELDPHLTLIHAHGVCDDVEVLIQKRFPRAEVMIHADPHGLRESRDTF